MKVLTLKQPWASLIAAGYKHYEFRSWKTNYRGKLIIHAGKGIESEFLESFKELNLSYPSSRFMCICDLTDCIKLNSDINKKIISENSLVYGHNPNRDGYAWVLENIQIIDNLEEIKGKLGLWDYNYVEK